MSINVRRSPIQWIFLGIHMAGPKLTADTFAQGMYNFPKTGGTPDAPLVFFTRKHPNAIKDFTEVWWNRNGSGRDETGKDGPGTLMKVDGGKRWLTGTWPRTEPKVFDPAGAVYTKDATAIDSTSRTATSTTRRRSACPADPLDAARRRGRLAHQRDGRREVQVGAGCPDVVRPLAERGAQLADETVELVLILR